MGAGLGTGWGCFGVGLEEERGENKTGQRPCQRFLPTLDAWVGDTVSCAVMGFQGQISPLHPPAHPTPAQVLETSGSCRQQGWQIQKGPC